MALLDAARFPNQRAALDARGCGRGGGAGRRLARNTGRVLIDEAQLARVDDPAAGSGAVEALMAKFCEAAWELFQQVEVRGGLPAAGAWLRSRIIGSASRRPAGALGAVRQVRDAVAAVCENEGRAPKLLVAKLGQDGHDRGQKVIASAFADFGFAVEVGDLFATAEAVAEATAAEVHAIGLSTLAAGHLALVPQLRAALDAAGRADIAVVVGGIIPPDDFAALRAAGAEAIFPPGTPVTRAASEVLDVLNGRLGYAQRPAAE